MGPVVRLSFNKNECRIKKDSVFCKSSKSIQINQLVVSEYGLSFFRENLNTDQGSWIKYRAEFDFMVDRERHKTEMHYWNKQCVLN